MQTHIQRRSRCSSLGTPTKKKLLMAGTTLYIHRAIRNQISHPKSVDSNMARWINHKCGQNNCEIIHQPEYADYPWVTARRNIKAGEELTYSYGRDFWSKACSSDRLANPPLNSECSPVRYSTQVLQLRNATLLWQ